jgi:hypothetical protein
MQNETILARSLCYCVFIASLLMLILEAVTNSTKRAEKISKDIWHKIRSQTAILVSGHRMAWDKYHYCPIIWKAARLKGKVYWIQMCVIFCLQFLTETFSTLICIKQVTFQEETQTCLHPFDVHVTVHRRHSESKEPTICDKVCSFIASTCFGHQYAHHQEYN